MILVIFCSSFCSSFMHLRYSRAMSHNSQFGKFGRCSQFLSHILSHFSDLLILPSSKMCDKIIGGRRFLWKKSAPHADGLGSAHPIPTRRSSSRPACRLISSHVWWSIARMRNGIRAMRLKRRSIRGCPRGAIEAPLLFYHDGYFLAILVLLGSA